MHSEKTGHFETFSPRDSTKNIEQSSLKLIFTFLSSKNPVHGLPERSFCIHYLFNHAPNNWVVNTKRELTSAKTAQGRWRGEFSAQ